MKSSLFRSLVIFVAGAGSATVVAGLYPRRSDYREKFLDRSTGLLAEVERLGGYVGLAEDGRVGIYTNVGACVPLRLRRNGRRERSIRAAWNWAFNALVSSTRVTWPKSASRCTCSASAGRTRNPC